MSGFPVSDSRYEAIFHNLPFIAFTLDTKGNVVDANEYTVELFGAEQHDVLGKSFSKSVKLSKVDLLHAFSEFRKNLGGKVTKKSIYRVEFPDGRKKTLELIGIPLMKDGRVEYVLDVGEDVTDREAAAAALQNTQNLLNSIIDQSPYAMWISDGNGTLIRINDACLRTLNIQEKEVVGRYNVLKDDSVEEAGFMPLVNDVFSKGKVARFKMTYSSGKVRHLDLRHHVEKVLDITIFPIKDASGKVTNAVLQHIDVTEEAKMKDEVEEKVEELEKFGKFSVGRELRMVELKNRVAELEKQLAGRGGK